MDGRFSKDSAMHNSHEESFGQSFLPFNNLYTDNEANSTFNNLFALDQTNVESDFQQDFGFNFMPPDTTYKFSTPLEQQSTVPHTEQQA